MDERLAEIERQKQAAINESNNTYNNLLTDNENLYKQQNEYANQYETTQNNILDKQLAFQTEQINKQKDIARQNMETESKKAKNDYTSFVNPYGVNAEQQASAGLNNAGYSETTKLGGWNTYQNRLSNANKAMQDAFTQYDKDMNQAILNNDVQKAQNALNKLQMQLEYSQNYYSNKSTISQNRLSNNQNLDSDYFNRYQTTYKNIKNEEAAAEAIRQFNEQMAYQRERAAVADAQWQKEYNLSVSKSRSGGSGSSSGGSYSLSNGSSQLDNFGNNSDTQAKSDYYFKSTTGADYQPRYINNTKVTHATTSDGKNIKLGDVGQLNGVSKTKNIWQANGKYYVWDEDHYIDVSSMIK